MFIVFQFIWRSFKSMFQELQSKSCWHVFHQFWTLRIFLFCAFGSFGLLITLQHGVISLLLISHLLATFSNEVFMYSHFRFLNGSTDKLMTYGCSHAVLLHFSWQWMLAFWITPPMRLVLSIYSEIGYLLANNVRLIAAPSGFKLQRSKHSMGTQLVVRALPLVYPHSAFFAKNNYLNKYFRLLNWKWFTLIANPLIEGRIIWCWCFWIIPVSEYHLTCLQCKSTFQNLNTRNTRGAQLLSEISIDFNDLLFEND